MRFATAVLAALLLPACGGGGGSGASPGACGRLAWWANGTVRCLAPVPDGSDRLVIGGDFTAFDFVAANRIARVDADGGRDAAFDVGTGFSGGVHALPD